MAGVRPKPGLTKYEALAAALEDRLQGLQPHDALPTERELMIEFGVSRVTVRQALSRLIARGLVYNVQGSGTYVADPEVLSKTLRLTGFSEDMRGRGLRPASVVLNTATVTASPETARRLDLRPGAELITIHRLRLADETPMALEVVEFPADLVDWSGVDLDGSIYEQLEERGVRIARAAQSIDAVNLDAWQARHLDQAVGAAAIRVRRVSSSGRGQPVEYGETIYRADRYSFNIVVTREG